LVGKIMWLKMIKPHFVIDKNGIPLATDITIPQGSDHFYALPIVDQIKILNGRKGRPRTRPTYLVADKGYGCRNFRNGLRKRSIRHQVPPVKQGGKLKFFYGRPIKYQPLLYKERWKVERTIAWFSAFRQINVCFNRFKHVYKAFCIIASIIIALRYF
jgi:transposase